MTEVLTLAGYRAAETVDEAEIVLLNTCSVRDKAEQKLRSEVGRLGMRKAHGESKTIVVAGCVAQQEGEKLLRAAPEIDLVIGPDNVPELPSLLSELRLGGPRQARTRFDLEEPSFLSIQTEVGKIQPATYVTTMKGCDERCSYCIVPYTRGSERYRASGDIVTEIERVVSKGTREVTLLGQTVNSYTDPSGALSRFAVREPETWTHTSRLVADQDLTEFPALLNAIVERGGAGLRRLRYVSPHPRHVTRGLIAAHRNLPVLCRHVHMPVQSGSNRVLKRMIRRYTVEEYIERVSELQSAVPGLTVSTDVIVGFPGETREDFEATLRLVERMQFVGLFGFKYSERPGTPALRLKDDVSEEEKSIRLAELFEVSEAHRRRHYDALVGTRQAVLIEGQRPDGGWTGRTERNEIVHLACAGDIRGAVIDVLIRRAFKNSLAGEAVDPSLNQPISQLPRLRLEPRDLAPPPIEQALAAPAAARRVLKVV
jgi:tRNA-2-methylthio-N6-dimethylallyladenosine synthase